MNLMDQLAFGPGRDRGAWIKSILLVLTLVGLLVSLSYFSVAIDYSFLKAALYSGTPQGQYHAVAKKLEQAARDRGGSLQVVATAGAMDNIARLDDPASECAPGFAFVQDGLPISADAGIQILGRLPQPETLFLLMRRGRNIANFADLKHAKIGLGPVGSGTDYLMRQILEMDDINGLQLQTSNYDFETEAALVARGSIDVASIVMNENSPLIRKIISEYGLEILSPDDIEGMVSRLRWLRIGRIPSGFFDVTQPSPETDRLVAQVDTLIVANECVHRAERVAFLMLMSHEFPSFIRSNPPPAAKSQDQAPLAEEARKFFAVGEPEFADKYFPVFVDLMSPTYWIYLLMLATVVINALGIYSRFRLWRIDANREQLDERLKLLLNARQGGGLSSEADSDGVSVVQRDHERLLALRADFDLLHRRCRSQLKSIVTPMGSEIYYRYQQALIEEAQRVLGELLRADGAVHRDGGHQAR
ncbi:MAG: TAXI family TRAP transporter solute-binding subunit [Aestuariivirga sp.]|uniref:TAXI family TRAP transporter solute-binding subunit n=1 Tax=Aestuariivirga sp. TaxID=2650926 RepID=UPI00301A46B8